MKTVIYRYKDNNEHPSEKVLSILTLLLRAYMNEFPYEQLASLPWFDVQIDILAEAVKCSQEELRLMICEIVTLSFDMETNTKKEPSAKHSPWLLMKASPSLSSVTYRPSGMIYIAFAKALQKRRATRIIIQSKDSIYDRVSSLYDGARLSEVLKFEIHSKTKEEPLTPEPEALTDEQFNKQNHISKYADPAILTTKSVQRTIEQIEKEMLKAGKSFLLTGKWALPLQDLIRQNVLPEPKNITDYILSVAFVQFVCAHEFEDYDTLVPHYDLANDTVKKYIKTLIEDEKETTSKQLLGEGAYDGCLMLPDVARASFLRTVQRLEWQRDDDGNNALSLSKKSMPRIWEDTLDYFFAWVSAQIMTVIAFTVAKDIDIIVEQKFDSFKSEHISDETNRIIELSENNKALQERIDRCEEEISSLNAELRKEQQKEKRIVDKTTYDKLKHAEHQISDLRKKTEQLQRENDALRKMLDSCEEEEGDEALTCDRYKKYVFVLNENKALTLATRIKEKFPNAEIVSDNTRSFPTKMDAMIVLTRLIDHNIYYKCREFCLNKGIQLIHCSNSDLQKIETVIAKVMGGK